MRTVLANRGHHRAGLRATAATAAAFAMVFGACQAGPPSAAGLATGGPSAIVSGPSGSSEAGASGGPSGGAGASAAAGSSSQPTVGPTPAPTPKSTAKPTPRPTATPSTSPAIASFQVASSVSCGGYSDVVQIQISWTVRRATGVTISIDGPGIYDSYAGATGQAMVPFACGPADTKHTYTIRTTGGSGPAAKLTKTVKRTN